jgi:hypothetical protein
MNREEELRMAGQPSQMGFLFGMRRLSRSEILSGSFEERGEAESDAEDDTDSGEDDSAGDERRPDAGHEQ